MNMGAKKLGAKNSAEPVKSKAIYLINAEDLVICKIAKKITDHAIDRYNIKWEVDQLRRSNFNFQVGDEVKVIRNLSGHGFKLNSVVILISRKSEKHFVASDGVNEYSVYTDEILN